MHPARTPLAFLLSLIACAGLAATEAPASWIFDKAPPTGVGEVTVSGTPKAVEIDGVKALSFNGATDGLVLAENPLRGLKQFTIQVLFRPDPDGPPAQRFVHIDQAQPPSRALLEIRLSQGKWCLDTFLQCGSARMTLIDHAKLFAAGKWYWAALRYDGSQMSCYVNGQLQGAGKVVFPAMTSGQTAVGVRLTHTYWFKGQIAKAVFSRSALDPAQLLSTGN